MLAAFAALALLDPGAAAAFEAAPLAVTDHSPFGILYGVPAPGPAQVLPAGATQLQLSAAAANHFFAATSAGESVSLDGETHRIALQLRRGIAAGEWTVELPYVSHSGGSLDGLIRRWHDWFSLPQGGRDTVPDNRMQYSYLRGGVARVQMTQPASGAGDVRVGFGAALSRSEAHPLALRAELKLPTGDASRLTGSGAADLALWLSGATAVPGAANWRAYGGGGIAALGKGDVLPELQRGWVPFGNAGIAWRVLPDLQLKAQLDAHGSLYRDSGLPPLGRSVVQVAVGGSLRLGARSEFEFAVLEDLAVGTAPDVTLQAVLKLRY